MTVAAPGATVQLKRATGVWRGRGIDGFELAVLVGFAGLSVWVLGLDLWQVAVHHRVWTGTDGVFVYDQMEYLGWIRGASSGGLASNLFVLRHTPADYLQPAVALSGGITALGAAPWLALLLWKPVAVGGLFFATRAYIHHCLQDRAGRRAALVVALFFGWVSITSAPAPWLGGGTHDLWLGLLSWLWGYPFGLLALTLLVVALLAYERDRAAQRLGWLPPVLGALACWLHPWQGETLIATLLGIEVLRWRHGERPSTRLLLITIGATAIPLVYYGMLAATDRSWRLSAHTGRGSMFTLGILALSIAPLALPAALAYRVRAQTFIAAATRVWPIAAFGIFLLCRTPLGTTPLHAFLGVTIPLAVLAVEGIRTIRWETSSARRVVFATLAIAAVTIPATVNELRTARRLAAPRSGVANFIAADERTALHYLATDPRPGGVITRLYLGAVVPADTGRRTYVGNCQWSLPDCSRREQLTDALFRGKLAPSDARSFARTSGARFLLADCRSRPDLQTELAPIISSVHRFGCATVYVVN